MTEPEIRTAIQELDERDDVTLPEWEAGFVESVLTRRAPLTEKQRATAVKILERYTAPADGDGDDE